MRYWEKFTDTLQVRLSEDGVLWLTKVNADVGYGISMRMLSALQAIFTGLKDDDSIRAIVIDAPDNAHQNGAVMVGEIKPKLSDLSREDFSEIVSIGHGLGDLIAEADVPVVSIARGGALGGGFELMLRSDFIFCTDKAEFCLPEVTVGFIAAWGGTQMAGRLMPYRKAQELLLTGRPISGAQAEEYGLVTRSFADSGALQQHVDDLLQHFRHCSPASFRWTKQCLAAIWKGDISIGKETEREAQVETMEGGDFLRALGAYSQGSYFDFVSGTDGRKR